MDINKKKVKTLDENSEPPAMDKVEERVEAEMKRIEGRAKEQVATGLNNDELARKGRKMKENAESELKQLRREDGEE